MSLFTNINKGLEEFRNTPEAVLVDVPAFYLLPSRQPKRPCLPAFVFSDWSISSSQRYVKKCRVLRFFKILPAIFNTLSVYIK